MQGKGTQQITHTKRNLLNRFQASHFKQVNRQNASELDTIGKEFSNIIVFGSFDPVNPRGVLALEPVFDPKQVLLQLTKRNDRNWTHNTGGNYNNNNNNNHNPNNHNHQNYNNHSANSKKKQQTQNTTQKFVSPFSNSVFMTSNDIAGRFWLYIDDKRCIQGPFTTIEMDNWFNKGYFAEDLMISFMNKQMTSFFRLDQLFTLSSIKQNNQDQDTQQFLKQSRVEMSKNRKYSPDEDMGQKGRIVSINQIEKELSKLEDGQNQILTIDKIEAQYVQSSVSNQKETAALTTTLKNAVSNEKTEVIQPISIKNQVQTKNPEPQAVVAGQQKQQEMSSQPIVPISNDKEQLNQPETDSKISITNQNNTTSNNNKNNNSTFSNTEVASNKSSVNTSSIYVPKNPINSNKPPATNNQNNNNQQKQNNYNNYSEEQFEFVPKAKEDPNANPIAKKENQIITKEREVSPQVNSPAPLNSLNSGSSNSSPTTKKNNQSNQNSPSQQKKFEEEDEEFEILYQPQVQVLKEETVTETKKSLDQKDIPVFKLEEQTQNREEKKKVSNNNSKETVFKQQKNKNTWDDDDEYEQTELYVPASQVPSNNKDSQFPTAQDGGNFEDLLQQSAPQVFYQTKLKQEKEGPDTQNKKGYYKNNNYSNPGYNKYNNNGNNKNSYNKYQNNN